MTSLTPRQQAACETAADTILALQAANESKQKLRLLLADSQASLDAQLAAQSFDAGDFTIRLA